MVSANERPYANSNFLVDLGDGDPRSPGAGFCEVIFPEFRAASPKRTPPRPASEQRDAAASRRLVLRRGVTGSLDLYAWWDKTRRSKAPPRRTVKVQLLAEDHSTVVLIWYFRGARVASLAYSPLNALQGSVLIETVELDFDSMEMSAK